MAMTVGARPSQSGPRETESRRDDDNQRSHDFHWLRAQR